MVIFVVASTSECALRSASDSHMRVCAIMSNYMGTCGGEQSKAARVSMLGCLCIAISHVLKVMRCCLVCLQLGSERKRGLREPKPFSLQVRSQGLATIYRKWSGKRHLFRTPMLILPGGSIVHIRTIDATQHHKVHSPCAGVWPTGARVGSRGR